MPETFLYVMGGLLLLYLAARLVGHAWFNAKRRYMHKLMKEMGD